MGSAVSYLVDKGPHNWLTLESFDVKNHLCFWFQKFNSDIPKSLFFSLISSVCCDCSMIRLEEVPKIAKLLEGTVGQIIITLRE